MSKATHTLKPAVLASKLDPTTQARHVWRVAYSQARRMVRPGTRHGTGDMFAYFLAAGHRRFGDAAMPLVRAAGGCALARLHVHRAATGTREELAREGMLTRCVRLEPAPRGLGWLWAWTHDTLAGVWSARSLRSCRAAALRAERAARATEVQRRAVARGLAADRRAIEAGRYYAITDAGRAALAEAR